MIIITQLSTETQDSFFLCITLISQLLNVFILFLKLCSVCDSNEKKPNACKFPKHHPHFIIGHFGVNKLHDSLITQNMSSYISCPVFSNTSAANHDRFLTSAQTYYQESYF